MSITYYFGEFRLDSATRELWQSQELTELPRRTFDGLVFLVEHRERAVSRDELIQALWGRPVEDIQVTQLVMRLRRLLGDDSHEPRYIRAVPGFGYRWIAKVEERSTAVSHESAGLGDDASDRPNDDANPETAPPIAPIHSPRVLVPALLAIMLVLATIAVVGHFLLGRTWQTDALAREPGEAIVVMPLDIHESDQADIGWLRLGAMDLIAERMRDAGLPVSPSESVISALQTAAERPELDDLSALRHTLRAEIVVQGAVRQIDAGWIVELVATTSRGRSRTVQAQRTEVIAAARHAADLLLATLGQQAPSGSHANEALSERLQRARAAGLALELNVARAILNNAPDALRNEPELRHELAWIELRAGQPSAAMAITAELLDDPEVIARARLHARVLIAHGVGRVNEAGDWPAGKPYFDAAAAVLDDEPWAPELGRALAMRSAALNVLHRFDDAARDLGRARTLFEISGDRLGMAQVENYSGNLELERGRPNDALAHFRNAIEIDSSFSRIDALRANLSAMQRAQMQLLRWSDALDTSERLWDLRDQYQRPVDPHRRHSLDMHRAEILIALGRHREAEAILAGFSGRESDVPDYGRRYQMELRARLAWQQDDGPQAFHWSGQALQLALAEEQMATRQPVELALLHQRASMRTATPVEATALLPLQPTIENRPAELVARAEWAAHHNDHEAAERYFRQAAVEAESRAVPAAFVLVADAFARWLLEHGRTSEALTEAGRIARWADDDYGSAMVQLLVLHSSDRSDARGMALARVRRLAGERTIPPELLTAAE